MKLLFDENLSPQLVALLADVYAGSAHVRDLGLRGAEDERIWRHARDGGYCIVSKDNDFRALSFLHGAPPKVVWLAVGNASTRTIEALIRREHPRLRTFQDDVEASLLVLPMLGLF